MLLSPDLYDKIERLIEQHRKNPDDSIINAMDNSNLFTEEELVANVTSFFFAGNDLQY